MKIRTPFNHLLEMKVEPRNETDLHPLMTALNKFASGDRFCSFVHHPESGEIILRGKDELHLDGVIDEIKSRYGIDIAMGAPQVSYLEWPERTAEADYTHKRLKSGIGEFARVILQWVLPRKALEIS